MSTSVIEVERADALLEAAHRSGYRYPAGFTGFAATLDVGVGFEARIEVRIDEQGVSVAAAREVDEWPLEQIRSIVSHRLGRPYSEGDGRHEKRVVEDGHPLGALIELEDGMESSYRLADDQITLVTRKPGPARFSIAIQERRQVTEGVFVPKAFGVFYWDRDGGLDAAEAYSDVYVEVGPFLLPAGRRVIRADRDGVSARELTLTGHRLPGEVGS